MVRSQVIRSAALSGYMKASADVGLDPHVMLQRAGLRNDCLFDPDLIISYRTFLQLLDDSATLSDHRDFGARAAVARGIPDLGPVSLLLREAETMEDALNTLIEKVHLHGDGVEIAIDRHPNDTFIALRIVGPSDVDTLQAAEYCACGFVQVVRWLLGSNWKPLRVCFSHESSGQTNFQRTFFQSPVSYRDAASGILIDRQTLRRPVEISTPFLRRQTRRYLDSTLESLTSSFSDRVAKVIAQRLPREDCSADNVAETFGIDRRTLSRRLAREGKSYASLLQQTRHDVALQLAADSRVSLSKAAEQTGFQNLSSFSRWFRRTFNHSATQWRQVARKTTSPSGPDRQDTRNSHRNGL